MMIKLPAEVGFADPSKVVCKKVEVLDKDPLCSAVTDNKTKNNEKLLKVVLQGKGQSTALTGPKKLSFSIERLRNPYSTATSSSFHVQLLDSKGNKIAFQDQGVTIQVSEGSPFQKAAITPSSKVNGMETSYRFQLTLKNPLPTRTMLTITAPPEVTFSPTVGSRVSCEGRAALNNKISCIWQKNQILASLYPTSDLKSGDVVDFSLPLVKNPPSMKKSSSFMIKAEHTDNNKVNIISVQKDNLFVQNTEYAAITQSSVSAGRLGAVTSYNFSFSVVNPLPAKGFIKVNFPREILRMSNVALNCSGKTMTKKASGDLQCAFQEQNAQNRWLTISLDAP